MKKFLIVLLSVFFVFELVGCTEGQNTPGSTIVGAAAGGLIGGLATDSVAGGFAGALIGGSLGYIIGRQMDRQDRINMSNAIVDTPINEEAEWTNRRTEVTYRVRPTRQYRDAGRYCRNYTTRIRINGRWRTAYGKACRTRDGRWRIVR